MTARQNLLSHGPRGASQAPIPLERLAREIYDEATPSAQQRMRALLVGKVFESASAELRRRLVFQLMAPLGILSLVAVANGAFTPIRLRGGLADSLQQIRPRDVAELAQHAQQVHLRVLDTLAPLLDTPALLADSAAAVLLLQILEHRPRSLN